MNLRTRLKGGTAVLLASAAVLSTPALAQETQTVDELVVTANRREQALNDVGMAIQAFGAEQLESLRVTNVQDLSAVAPSFTVSRSYQGVPTYTLRGIGFNTINMSATSTVGTYVDEVAYAYPMMLSGPVFDLERVEVLKGPQGTLYGRNTTAGLINFVTQKPSHDFQARGVAEFGNYETYNFEGMVSGPLADNLQGRIAFRSETSNQGWQKSASRNERLGKVDRFGVRGSLAFQPTEYLSVDASVNYWANKSDTLAAQAIGFTPGTTPQTLNPLGAGFHNAPGLANFINNQKWSNDTADWAPSSRRTSTVAGIPGVDKPLQEDSTFLGGKLNIRWDINDDLRLVSLTSYNKIERKGVMDWAGAPYNVLIQDADGEIKSFAQELRVEGGNDRVTWLIGGYYGKDDIVDTNQTLFRDNANVRLFQALTAQLALTPANTGPLPGGQGPGGSYSMTQAANTFQTYRDDGRIETKTASIFASADWKLSDTLSLTTGIRYTQDKQDANICSRDVNGSMLPNLNVTNKYLYNLRYAGVVITDNVVANGCSTTRINWATKTATRGEVITSLDEDNIAWRLALNWNASDDVLVYGSISKGAKSGGAPVNTASLYEQNLPVGQEKLLAYEVGVKAGLFERRVQANLSAFYYDYTDKQMSTYNPDALYTALARLQNIPESLAYGLDGEVTWRVTDNFTAIGAATFLHTEIKGFVGTDGAGLPRNYDGAGFLYSPEFLGSMTFVYERELTDGMGLKATLNGRYQKESQADLEGNPLYRIPAYGLLNGSVGITAANGRWEATLWGRNLTDEYYWTAVASNANTVVRFPGQPRTFGVALTLKY
ncbi:TonB-dependent receptor [Caulobacter mirabilis]|uniref:TonB-dependent receptor n=1 Tax=Caulobacter mirabilis TaxID=69666 RepID=A0A2D2ASQ9_9CAUL|nr:TonB-dependent receptor [Caulobacter mirabilis]ATQ41013.1 TonB-dependent receptor [Caulobacter mirabilis]